MEPPDKTELAKRIWQSITRRNRRVAPNIVALTATALLLNPAIASETTPAATTTAASEFTLEPDAKTYEKERKEIEAFLQNVERQWNSHNLEGVMGSYSDDYVNNDGLDKSAVLALTQDFWKTYPDAKSSSKTKQIRVDGLFATVESRDVATGSTGKEMPGIQSKGELKSISEGQLYLRKIGTGWKIIGDRVDYEKVRVAFGLAKQVEAAFTAPEQVRSGRQYSAKLDVSVPKGLKAIGSISSQPLQFPQPSMPEERGQKEIDDSLERVMAANTTNRNELLMATVGLAKLEGATANLVGVILMSRRLNVVPAAIEDEKKKSEKIEKSEKVEKSEKTEKGTEDSDKNKSKDDDKETDSKKDDTKEDSGKSDKPGDGDSDEKKDADKPESQKDDEKPKSEIKQKENKKNRTKSATDEESQNEARARRARKAQEKREKKEKAKVKSKQTKSKEPKSKETKP